MSFFQVLRARFPFGRSYKPVAAHGNVGAGCSGNSVGELPDRSRDRHAATDFSVGQELVGAITGIADYGLFVRLGNGESGLVYQSEICWVGQDITYSVGDRVKVRVIGFKEGKGLSLSIRKALIQDAFDAFVQNCDGDAPIKGRVKSVVDYGVFVTISPGVEGLLHVSDIPDISIYGKSSIGQLLDVQIMSVEADRRRVRVRLAE